MAITRACKFSRQYFAESKVEKIPGPEDATPLPCRTTRSSAVMTPRTVIPVSLQNIEAMARTSGMRSYLSSKTS